MLVALWSPPPPQPKWRWEWIDETVHVSLFFGFAIAWAIALGRPRWVAAAGVALAIATELVQPLLPWERTAQLGDAIADAVGLALGLAIVRVARRTRASAARANDPVRDRLASPDEPR